LLGGKREVDGREGSTVPTKNNTPLKIYRCYAQPPRFGWRKQALEIAPALKVSSPLFLLFFNVWAGRRDAKNMEQTSRLQD
jgi:hypothetical protein